MSEPQNTVLITPTLMSNSIHVALPIIGMVPMAHVHIPLTMRLTTPPMAWGSSLWHDLQSHGNMDQLQQAFCTNTRIMVVSDAAVHNNRQVTCTWVIWAGRELWGGEGCVPGHPDDMYLGLDDFSYEVATVLGFMNHYLNMYPFTLSHS